MLMKWTRGMSILSTARLPTRRQAINLMLIMWPWLELRKMTFLITWRLRV